jgi:hypothetical protein
MQVIQELVADGVPSPAQLARLAGIQPQLVLAFWGGTPLGEPAFVPVLRTALPAATLIGCSTAGEINTHGVSELSCVLTAIRFDRATFTVAQARTAGLDDSRSAGQRLGAALPKARLRGVLLLAPGVNINGTALIQGFSLDIPAGVPVSGGLAGDNGAFVQTFVLGPDGATDDTLVAVGFYGEHLQFSTGCRGGWSAFGPTRRITRADGSCLYELDGQPALELYRRYLGDYARDLPAAGLLFPFEMLDDEKNFTGLLRTIIGIDDSNGSLLLAGTVTEGAYLRLMHATTNALVDGAELAAVDSAGSPMRGDGLGLLVSCVGRKLVMGDRVDEEVVAVAEQLGTSITLAGFYSNGEISPLGGMLDCKLHNQTMTIALLGEC